MKILLTNDDGINAPGLWAAAEALCSQAEVHIVAPDREQSGVGPSLTLHTPVRATSVQPQIAVNAHHLHSYAVEGTPGDSCVLALERLVGKVDLVVSGINSGSNVGSDVLLSGTVGGALHGYLRGLPSIAISVAAVKDARFDVASPLLGSLVRCLPEKGLEEPFFLNINVPNLPSRSIGGVRISHLARHGYRESVTEGEDGRRKYYWIVRNRPGPAEEEGSDAWTIKQGLIAITPLDFSLTGTDSPPWLTDIVREMSSQLYNPPPLAKQDVSDPGAVT